MARQALDPDPPQASAVEVSAPCPVCSATDFVYMWSVDAAHLAHCAGCGLVHRYAATSTTAGGRAESDDLRVMGAPGSAPDTLVVTDQLLSAAPPGRVYARAVVGSTLSAAVDPAAVLRRIRGLLAPDGVLVIHAALIDETPKRRWQGWGRPVHWHFTRQTLHLLLLRSGFDRVWCQPQAGGRTVVSAQRSEAGNPSSVSIIVPVFNEQRTCAALLDRLIAKELPGLEREIIIVESHSTDGTRDIVERYRHRPGVRLIFEDRPRGKGHAVRTGLAAARGACVLIQDADLEYDIDDYDALLQPLRDWQALFILGSRHAGHWKMRVFNDAPVTAGVFNLGHLFYTRLVNTVLRTDMSDPFTMFKVFRRDCLYGLTFEGRRFDFDFELVMKLVRKGCMPVELPVNYNARSFTEGKKVSFVRDGLTWIWAVAKFGFGPLGPGDRDRFPAAPRP